MEYVEHSWYTADSGNVNPRNGVTGAAYSAPDVNGRYSWVKAPRLDGHAMEVGPLARMLVAYAGGVKDVQAIVDETVTALGAPGQPEILLSLLGRVAARNLETRYVAGKMVEWVDELLEAMKSGRREVLHRVAGRRG